MIVPEYDENEATKFLKNINQKKGNFNFNDKEFVEEILYEVNYAKE